MLHISLCVPFWQHSVEIKLLGERKNVPSVFIPTPGSDITLGTHSSLPSVSSYKLDTLWALGTHFSVPSVLFPEHSVQMDWIPLDKCFQTFFCEPWFQEYTSMSKLCKFLSYIGNITNLNKFLGIIGFIPNLYQKHDTYLSLIRKNLIYGHIEFWIAHLPCVSQKFKYFYTLCICFVVHGFLIKM
jgi:hypothetical protein